MNEFYAQSFLDLLITKKDYILTISLNNPKMSNAITEDMICSLEKVLLYADQDKSVRAIILTGEGKNFCAGGDLRAMEENSGMFAGESNELRVRYQFGIQRIPKVIESLQTPIIAAVNGAAIGAGCDLAMMCDMRVASPKAKFGETFTKLGLVPGDGGTYFLQRVVGYAKAMELSLTGDIIGAQEALDIRMVNKLSESFMEDAEELALKVASNAPVAIQLTKKAIKKGHHDKLEDQLDLLSSYQGIAQRTSDHYEGIKAFKEKRAPNFKSE